jgi:hypothetical protein
MEPVLALCHSGAVKPRDVPQSVFPFDDAIEAWLSHDLRTVVARQT